MKRDTIIQILLSAACLALGSCMDYGPHAEEAFENRNHGVFILCEGNFMYGTASLSYYDASARTLENGLFLRVNGEKLGDTGQSMVIRNGRGYIVVNNSGRVSVVNPSTLRVTGEMTGLTSPRYIAFASDDKAYLSDLLAGRITRFDPRTLEITGYIATPGHASTEQMALWGDYLFVACWSYDDTLLVIDTRTDRIVDELRVGVQPAWVVADRHGKIWCMTDGGGYPENPAGYEPARLCRIDPATRRIEQTLFFDWGDAPSELVPDGAGERLYFINGDVWCMSVDDTALPTVPLIPSSGTRYYGLGVDPLTSEIYVADAIDYAQSGVVYRMDAQGRAIDTLRVGVIPGAFCFKTAEDYNPIP